MAKPKQNGVRKSVYISKELEEALEKEAAEKGTNFSNLVRMILVERNKEWRFTAWKTRNHHSTQRMVKPHD